MVDEQLELAAAKLPVLAPVHPSPVNHDELNADHASIEDLLLGNAEARPEMLEEMAALQDAPELGEEELARQALAHGGADDDPATPVYGTGLPKPPASRGAAYPLAETARRFGCIKVLVAVAAGQDVRLSVQAWGSD